MIRDQDTSRADFIFYSNRIIRLLVEEGLNHLPVVAHTVTSPVGKDYVGVKFEGGREGEISITLHTSPL